MPSHYIDNPYTDDDSPDSGAWLTAIVDNEDYLDDFNEGNWEEYEIAKEFEHAWLNESDFIEQDEHPAVNDDYDPYTETTAPVTSGIIPDVLDVAESVSTEKMDSPNETQIAMLRSIAQRNPEFRALAKAAESYSYEEAKQVLIDINKEMYRRPSQSKANAKSRRTRSPRAM